ncbi:MAG: UDP-N-acetylglucosamine pyrophosphorylase [Planctomycetota bacterium]|nr:MAG: UDP-N-acetylglucosamine pyrophosphorylase [Planctomycetota bacterium]
MIQTSGTGRSLAAIILAAGRSTRMMTELPKVMHEVGGRPMLAHVIDACREAGIDRFYLVVGFAKEAIISAFSQEPGVHFVEQREQKGTGHAVQMCKEALAGFTGDCVVIAGDMPLIRSETLRNLITAHRAASAAASLATTALADPTGYGRIIRDAKGDFTGIVEHRDCTPEQLSITEVNPSYYCFDAVAMFEAMDQIKPNNAKGEYYITDALTILRAAGRKVLAAAKVPAEDATGINSRAELAMVNKMMQARVCNHWMASGVTLIDPDNTWIDGRATIGAETVILPFCYIEAHAKIGTNCRIGPFAHVAAGAVVADGATIGPGLFAAFDATGSTRPAAHPAGKKTVQVVRRPPAQSGCS